MSEHDAAPGCEHGELTKLELAPIALQQYQEWMEGHALAQRLFYGMVPQPTPTTSPPSVPVAWTKSEMRGLGSRGPLKPGVGSNSDAF